MSRALKLGMTFGYWAKGPNPDVIEQAQVAESLGFDSIWTAESWGNDAFTFAAWIAAHTKRVRIGTGIVQMAARTPSPRPWRQRRSIIFPAVVSSSDSECPGRRSSKAGTANPRRARWLAPANTLRSVRRVLRREDGPLEFAGEFYQHPYSGPGSVGLGKPLKLMIHPLRTELPIFIAAEGPKNVTQTAEIADGWLPALLLALAPGDLRRPVGRRQAQL
jgi:alkanesulfonate monooxygenase SsuD/methylene tetrahydromethanopterin reductase-like flavin-dependent oxidoreductase (luciferase family)